MSNSDESMHWFAMSAPYQRELKAQHLLGKASIECFIPMCYKIVVQGGRKRRAWLPAISNLIFVHTTRPIIQQTKRFIPFLQYHTRPEEGRNVPIIVPDDQMDQFIKVSHTQAETLVYLTGEELKHLNKGTRVRILGGLFDGVEGTFVRVKGYRSKHVVVQIQGLIAVIIEVHPDLIEIID